MSHNKPSATDCKKDINVGDYVLATKYSDGDPCDPFAVGFVSEVTDKGRYIVVDNLGVSFRGNGFRRAERISQQEGHVLVELIPRISNVRGGPSLWWHLSSIKGEDQRMFCNNCMYESSQMCRCQ